MFVGSAKTLLVPSQITVSTPGVVESGMRYPSPASTVRSFEIWVRITAGRGGAAARTPTPEPDAIATTAAATAPNASRRMLLLVPIARIPLCLALGVDILRKSDFSCYRLL